jgi:hypothetical protein
MKSNTYRPNGIDRMSIVAMAIGRRRRGDGSGSGVAAVDPQLPCRRSSRHSRPCDRRRHRPWSGLGKYSSHRSGRYRTSPISAARAAARPRLEEEVQPVFRAERCIQRTQKRPASEWSKPQCARRLAPFPYERTGARFIYLCEPRCEAQGPQVRKAASFNPIKRRCL